MVFNSVKSIKVFFALIMLFLLVSFSLIFLAGGTINETGVYKLIPLMPLLLKITIILTILFFVLIGIQTITCSCFSSIEKVSLNQAVHITAGLTIVFSSLFAFLPIYQFKGYSGSVVHGKDVAVVIKNINIDSESMSVDADVVVKSYGKKFKGKVSYNEPFISKAGILWIAGMDSKGLVFKYQPFYILPLLTFFTSLLFVFFLFLQTFKVLTSK